MTIGTAPSCCGLHVKGHHLQDAVHVVEALRILPLAAPQLASQKIERSIGHEEVQLLMHGIAET